MVRVPRQIRFFFGAFVLLGPPISVLFFDGQAWTLLFMISALGLMLPAPATADGSD